MMQVIKADPGYALVVAPGRWEPNFSFSWCPIVAWRIAGGGMPVPVTLGGSPTDQDNVILCPDGSVVQQGGSRYTGLNDWAGWARKEWEEDHARWLAMNPDAAAAE